MNPLALDIWLYIAVAYILVSITIWIVARFTPFEWHSTQPSCSERENIGIGGKHNYDRGDGFEYTSIHNNDDIDDNNIDDDDDCQHNHSDDNNENEQHHDFHHQHDHHQHHNHYHNNINNYDAPDENIDDNADEDYEDGHINIFDERNDLDYLTSTELLCMENDFTLRNSFWFTIGTLMQQGSDLNPKASRKRKNRKK